MDDEPTNGPDVDRQVWLEKPRFGRVRSLLLRLPTIAWIVQSLAREDRVRQLIRAGLELSRKKNIDLVYASVWPPTTAIAAARFAKSEKVPFIIDLRDPWSHCPEMPYRHISDFVLEWLTERSILRQADAVVVPTEGARQLLLRSFNLDPGVVCRIPNGFSPQEVNENAAEPQHFRLVYAGELSLRGRGNPSWKARFKRFLGLDYDPLLRSYEPRSLDALCCAVRDAIKTRPELGVRLKVEILGVNRDLASKIADEYGVGANFSFSPRLPPRVAQDKISAASVLLVMQVEYKYRGAPLAVAVPAKVYTYIDSGLPIIALTQEGDLADLVRSTGNGTVVSPNDSDGMASAIVEMFDDWRVNGVTRKRWERADEFSRRNQTGQLACLIKKVVGNAQSLFFGDCQHD
jgi:glycosyltransferase involved in cell wall biosynthesis